MGKTIYIVLYTLSVGGAERHASSVANYLVSKGYSVKILLIQNNKIDYVLDDRIEVIALSELIYPDKLAPGKVNLNNRLKLKAYKFISKRKYDYLERRLYLKATFLDRLDFYFSKEDALADNTVISFMSLPNIVSAMLKKKFGFKLILAEFTSPHYEFPPNSPENILKKEYYPDADAMIYQTAEQEEFYSYLTKVKKQVIPNPVEDILTEPFYGERKKEIVNYCTHVKAKNLPLLIEAFSKLVKEYPDYKLVIYGDGPERENTEKCIEAHGIEDKVVLKPYAKNVLDLVRESAMFVSSSDREGISNSMLEAMAIGLPTICTDCPAGGARMVIESYVNGIIVTVRDPEAMYKAMKYVIDNPEKAESMAKNAVNIRTTLEKNKILEQWFDFINNL